MYIVNNNGTQGLLFCTCMSPYDLIPHAKTLHRNKDSKKALVNQWIDDDFEWPSQKKSNLSHSGINMHVHNVKLLTF